MSNPTEKIIRDYLERMVQIRSTGGATSETSYYSALENLLNEIGKSLKPAIVCNGQLRNQGAGHPDFGVYSEKQCSKGAPKPGQGEIPERGVVEVNRFPITPGRPPKANRPRSISTNTDLSWSPIIEIFA